MSKIFTGTLNRLQRKLRTLSGSLKFFGSLSFSTFGAYIESVAGYFRCAGTLGRLQRKSRSLVGSLRFIGSLLRKNHAIRSLGGSFRIIGTLIASILKIPSLSSSDGIFHCVGTLNRFLHKQRTLSGSFKFLGNLFYSLVGGASVSIAGTLRFLASLTILIRGAQTLTGSLRMSGKIYILRETMYYGVINP